MPLAGTMSPRGLVDSEQRQRAGWQCCRAILFENFLQNSLIGHARLQMGDDFREK